MPFFNRVARATVVEPLSPKPNLFKKLRSKIGKKVKRTFKKRSRLPALDDGVVYRLEGGRLRTRTVAPRAIDAVIEELDEVLDQCLEKPDDYSDDEIPKNKMPKVSAELPKELYVIQEEDESETDESQIAETETEEVDQGPSDSASSKSLKIAQEVAPSPKVNANPAFELSSLWFVMRVVFTIVGTSMTVIFRARAKAWITNIRNTIAIAPLALAVAALVATATMQAPKLLE